VVEYGLIIATIAMLVSMAVAAFGHQIELRFVHLAGHINDRRHVACFLADHLRPDLGLRARHVYCCMSRVIAEGREVDEWDSLEERLGSPQDRDALQRAQELEAQAGRSSAFFSRSGAFVVRSTTRTD
jgi:hypothetical protein